MTQLVRLLGLSDACWMPGRNFIDRGVLAEAQKSWLEVGIPWKSGESDRTGQSHASKELAGLAADGLLELSQDDMGRTRRIRFTPEGDAVAREAAGLPQLADFHHLCRAMPNLSREKGRRDPVFSWRLEDRPPGWWLSEDSIIDGCGLRAVGPKYSPGAIYTFLAQLMLPAIVAGRVVWNTSVSGRIYYSYLTEAEMERPAPALVEGARDDAAERVYHKALNRAVDRLRVAVAVSGEIGPPPSQAFL